jgi:hypothetical protein
MRYVTHQRRGRRATPPRGAHCRNLGPHDGWPHDGFIG